MKKKAKKEGPKTKALSSSTRLEELLAETEQELEKLEPQIEKLEKQIEKLKTLKTEKQKLITLKLSIKSILSSFSESEASLQSIDLLNKDFMKEAKVKPSKELSGDHAYLTKASFPSATEKKWAFSPITAPLATENRPSGTFLPDMAFTQANQVLRKKTSLNYELFRAIVLNGGEANTEQIKAYLVEHNIKQPASGESFEQVELTDISSRVNYLVRKGLVNPDGRGNFVSCLGWAV